MYADVTLSVTETMDLMCNEKEMLKEHHIDSHLVMNMEPQVNTASADPTFLTERCLENLLKSEETHPTVNFYNSMHCEITPKMRRIVAEWMMEVNALNNQIFLYIKISPYFFIKQN